MRNGDNGPPDRVAVLKKPPHSIDAEQALLSCVLHGTASVLNLDIETEHFYRKQHRLLWAAAMELHEERTPVEFISVMERLKATGKFADAGGIEYLEELAQNHSSAANAVHYGELIKGRAIERMLISMAHSIADIGYNGVNGEGGETTQKLEEAFKLMNDFTKHGVVGRQQARPILPGIAESVKRVEKRFENQGVLPGLPTGFRDLDAAMNGMMDGDLIVVAGRPSMGKTQFSLNIAEHVSIAGHLVIFFSLEMQEWKLVDRMMCSVSGIDNGRYRRGELRDEDWDRLSQGVAKLRGAPLWIDEDTSTTSHQLLAKSRKIAHEANRKPALIVVDYLGLLNDEGEGTERVTKMTRQLKRTAKEMQCPMICLAQLNRGVENRPDKRPNMSDLRDSGSIEQDADIIIMLYRDEVYNKGTVDKGIAEVILVKQRDGPLTTVKLKANLSRSRFDNIDRNYTTTGVMPAPVQSSWMEELYDENGNPI